MPALLAFFGAFLSRYFAWLAAAWAIGALKTIAIYTIMFAAIVGAILGFFAFVNGVITDYINGMGHISQNTLIGIASFLPTNMPALAATIIGYYLLSLSVHLVIEIARMKARWAEKALSHFKVK